MFTMCTKLVFLENAGIHFVVRRGEIACTVSFVIVLGNLQRKELNIKIKCENVVIA